MVTPLQHLDTSNEHSTFRIWMIRVIDTISREASLSFFFSILKEGLGGRRWWGRRGGGGGVGGGDEEGVAARCVGKQRSYNSCLRLKN